MQFAWEAASQSESGGANHAQPRVVAHQRALEREPDEEGPWCSAFVNWCLLCGGHRGTGRANARSWLSWGEPLPDTERLYGCVAVFTRPPRPWEGHVGFFLGSEPGFVYVLGKSRSTSRERLASICIKSYPERRLLAYRWPAGLSRT
jgi:uncharacterized protein (TIGR02594 family)